LIAISAGVFAVLVGVLIYSYEAQNSHNIATASKERAAAPVPRSVAPRDDFEDRFGCSDRNCAGLGGPDVIPMPRPRPKSAPQRRGYQRSE
jgi:hypothetical protein